MAMVSESGSMVTVSETKSEDALPSDLTWESLPPQSELKAALVSTLPSLLSPWMASSLL